jgi:parallel beta-helix repeat protein
MKITFRILCALALTLAGLGWMRVSPAQAATTFYVDTPTDSHDLVHGNGSCYDAIGACSLRAAIEEASASAGISNPISIQFGSSGNYPLTLGTIYWPGSYVTLDGGTNTVSIDGSGFSTAQVMLQISGDYNTITNLTFKKSTGGGIAMGDFAGVGAGNHNQVTNSVIIGMSGPGIYIRGSSSSGGLQNQILNNKIGMTSTLSAGCQSGEANLEGIYIERSARNTRVEGNWIGCNGQGILIEGAYGAPLQTEIFGNYIGVNQAGAMGNTGNGVLDHLGQNTEVRNNLVSGNAYGIQFSQSSGGTVTGNTIGIDLSGQNAIPNNDGVLVTANATNVTIGSTSLMSDQNIISGNNWCGVRISDGANNTLLDFNFIGVKSSGTAALGNGKAGVCVIGAGVANVIGSNYPDPMQLISGNGEQGIYIQNTARTYVGSTNRIGVAINGVTAIPNGREGILLDGATNSQIAPTTVANNRRAGIAVIGSGASGNFISFFDNLGNGGLPIDLGNDGPTLNDPGDADSGPNGLLNYPVVTSVTGTTTQVLHGTACAGCQVSLFRVFRNPAANGGSVSFIAYVTADGTGSWSYPLPAGTTRPNISLVAQDMHDPIAQPASEMSPIYQVFLPLAVK